MDDAGDRARKVKRKSSRDEKRANKKEGAIWQKEREVRGERGKKSKRGERWGRGVGRERKGKEERRGNEEERQHRRRLRNAEFEGVEA